jgi:hypothetical protein
VVVSGTPPSAKTFSTEQAWHGPTRLVVPRQPHLSSGTALPRAASTARIILILPLASRLASPLAGQLRCLRRSGRTCTSTITASAGSSSLRVTTASTRSYAVPMADGRSRPDLGKPNTQFRSLIVVRI